MRKRWTGLALSISTLPVIVSDYTVLLAEDELTPILFVGRNRSGGWIVGSSVEDDNRWKLERRFHVPVTDGVYEGFRNRRFAYRQLITCSESIFVIDQPYDSTKPPIQYSIKPEDIPREYLPLEGSFCPAAFPEIGD